MSGQLSTSIVVAIVASALGAGSARADEVAAAPVADDPHAGDPDFIGIDDQEISAGVGLASGGRVTPGGLRVQGRYLYRMADDDWFDGAAAFTFGGGDMRCFRDRDDATVCDHGTRDGFGVEITAGVRRRFTGNGRFVPWIRAAVGGRLARFTADDVRGFAIPVVAAVGVRYRMAAGVAVGIESGLELGFGWFNRGLGMEPQFGAAAAGIVEFRLR